MILTAFAIWSLKKRKSFPHLIAAGAGRFTASCIRTDTMPVVVVVVVRRRRALSSSSLLPPLPGNVRKVDAVPACSAVAYDDNDRIVTVVVGRRSIQY